MIRDPPAMHKPENGKGAGDLKVALSSGRGNNTTTSGQNTSPGPKECASCGKVITEKFLLKALDVYWHEDCLKCGCCDARLGEVGSTLYTKADLILCKRDYLRLFGVTGNCVACNKVIPAFEMVMRAKNFVYHLECFACQQCNHRFCVGDRFYLNDNKILCEYDYEERLVFANMAHNPTSLAHVRRQVNALQSPNDATRLVMPPGAIGPMGALPQGMTGMVVNNGAMGSNGGQMGSNGGQMGSNSVPMGSNNIPMSSNNVPMGSNNIPMGSNGGPMGSNGVPMGSNGGPMGMSNGAMPGSASSMMGMNNGMGYPGSLGADKDMLMGGADDASSGYGSPDADTCDPAR